MTSDHFTWRILLVVSLTLLSFQSIYSQDKNKERQLDSLHTQLKNDSVYIYRFRKVRPYIKYTERNSIGNPHPVNFYGPQFGLVLFEKHILGVGYYLSSVRTRKAYPVLDGIIEASQAVDMRYGTLFYEYILFEKKYFELHLPFEGGYGYYHSGFTYSNGQLYREENKDLMMGACGIIFIAKPVRWLAVTGSLGGRTGNIALVDGFYYAVGFRLMLRNLSNDINYHLIKKKRYRSSVAALNSAS